MQNLVEYEVGVEGVACFDWYPFRNFFLTVS